jgi:hypothetical protein
MTSKRAPRAVADGAGGTIIGVADVTGPPERSWEHVLGWLDAYVGSR